MTKGIHASRDRLLSLAMIGIFDIAGPLVAYSVLRSAGQSQVSALVLSGVATQEEAELGPGYWLYVGAAVPHEELTPDHSRADVIVVLNRRGGRTVFP